jgi:hypothetical protein
MLKVIPCTNTYGIQPEYECTIEVTSGETVQQCTFPAELLGKTVADFDNFISTIRRGETCKFQYINPHRCINTFFEYSSSTNTLMICVHRDHKKVHIPVVVNNEILDKFSELRQVLFSHSN